MSSVSELERGQKEFVVHDDLAPYVGQWVALRDGHVVAHDIDLVRLRENPEAEPTDMIIAVGNPTDGFYFL